MFIYKREKTSDDYSAMRWPCPEGFHIPTFDEIAALRDMFNTMGLLSGGTSNFTSYLKIPTHRRLKWDLTRTNDVASTIRTCKENGGIWAWHIMSSTMGIMGSWYNSRWVPIRPFKDISIAPESSWTTVYDWSSTAIWAGVFWDATNWLISTSDDWLTWITIADKNLWATTVSTWRVDNDITRCWNFYQRWNNYWFTATISTTSSTKVDTTWYGPWNYYESSVWIETSNNRWFDPVNANLRWWVTWVVPSGYVLVEKQVYPGRLPIDYQEVEYIQSSGDWTNNGQFINPWITIEAWTKLKIEVDFQWTNQTTAERNIFAQYTDGANRFQLWFIGEFQARLNSDTNGSLPTTWTPSTYAYNTRYLAIAEWTSNVASSRPPFLFAQNEWDSYGRWCIAAKLYYCKIWKDDALVRDFIPCYRKSDNVIWLYDLVEKQFYTNQWSWTFTKWPNV